MLKPISTNRTLDALLELVCVNLQLTETQDQQSRNHYRAVTDWLSDKGSPIREFCPHIFTQGSQRLGTTTKPVGQTEFDLDAVCKLIVPRPCHPGELYQLIWDRLFESALYRPMMKRMPRCIRLEYSGNFHLDIAPAIPDTHHGGKCILVPDLNANLALDHPQNDQWKSTNPQDYADWFENQCIPAWVLNERYASAQVDPVPDRESVHAKPSLKRSVQLFKRWRDVEYADRQHLAPPSIILTTLSGNFYDGQQFCSAALQGILEATVQEIDSVRRIHLTNPAHPEENICEKWDGNPASYDDFASAVADFQERWERLQSLCGLPELENELSRLFGESSVRSAIRLLTERNVNVPRSSKSLQIERGTGRVLSALPAAAGLLIPSNTYHGDAN